jgi:gliding motility-associated-like protein
VYCRNEAAGGSVFIEVDGGIRPYYFRWTLLPDVHLDNFSSFIDSIQKGNYSVLITDSNGCLLEYNLIIGYLDEDCIVRIPQGFSPNGDGKNDVWEIRNLLYMHPDNRVRIFNRHGTLIFEAEKYDDDWDGTPNRGNVLLGQDGKVPQGVYYYMIWLEPDGKPINGYVYVSY